MQRAAGNTTPTPPPRAIEATAENLHHIVSLLRPDLVLMGRRDIEEAIATLLSARERMGHAGGTIRAS